MLSPLLLTAFPELEADDATVLHPPDSRYNCVAWAVGVTTAWWWPGHPDDHWPAGVPDEPTPAAVVAALGTAGYLPCADGVPEPGFEKAAVYAKCGEATHVAKQLPDGRWSSKLGRDGVVRHATVGGVEGWCTGRWWRT